jgi:hypothetical protein
MVVKGFIDYYPSKSCFVYPVYGDENNYYVLDQNSKLIKYRIDEDSLDYKFIQIISQRDVSNNLQNMYAFKRNITEIYYGSRYEITLTLLRVSHLLKDDLELYEEISIFIKNSDISNENRATFLSDKKMIEINHYGYLFNDRIDIFTKIGYEDELINKMYIETEVGEELYHSKEDAKKYLEKQKKKRKMYENRKLKLRKLINQK